MVLLNYQSSLFYSFKSGSFLFHYSFYKKGAGAGAKCDHQRIGVRARVRASLDLDVRGACVRRKKRSQLTPWKYIVSVQQVVNEIPGKILL